MNFRVTLFKIGKIFNPGMQDRTDAVDDLVKRHREKDKVMLDKMFKKRGGDNAE